MSDDDIHGYAHLDQAVQKLCKEEEAGQLDDEKWLESYNKICPNIDFDKTNYQVLEYPDFLTANPQAQAIWQEMKNFFPSPYPDKCLIVGIE